MLLCIAPQIVRMPFSGGKSEVAIPAVMVPWDVRQLLVSMKAATKAPVLLQKVSGICASVDNALPKPVLPPRTYVLGLCLLPALLLASLRPLRC